MKTIPSTLSFYSSTPTILEIDVDTDIADDKYNNILNEKINEITNPPISHHKDNLFVPLEMFDTFYDDYIEFIRKYIHFISLEQWKIKGFKERSINKE